MKHLLFGQKKIEPKPPYLISSTKTLYSEKILKNITKQLYNMVKKELRQTKVNNC